jgi:hypothetical protein
MYAVLVESASTCVAYSSKLTPQDTASTGTAGMLYCLLVGACCFVRSLSTFGSSWLTKLYKFSNSASDGGARMAALSSPLGYMCYGKMLAIITVCVISIVAMTTCASRSLR